MESGGSSTSRGRARGRGSDVGGSQGRRVGGCARGEGRGSGERGRGRDADAGGARGRGRFADVGDSGARSRGRDVGASGAWGRGRATDAGVSADGDCGARSSGRDVGASGARGRGGDAGVGGVGGARSRGRNSAGTSGDGGGRHAGDRYQQNQKEEEYPALSPLRPGNQTRRLSSQSGGSGSGTGSQSSGDRGQTETLSSPSPIKFGQGFSIPVVGRGRGVWGGSGTGLKEQFRPGTSSNAPLESETPSSGRGVGRGGGVWGSARSALKVRLPSGTSPPHSTEPETPTLGVGRGGVWGSPDRGLKPLPSATSQPTAVESETSSLDLVISDMQKTTISSSQSQPSGNANNLVPIKRPPPNKDGDKREKVQLFANHFLVTFDPEISIHRYDVSVFPKAGRDRSVKIPNSDLRTIIEKLLSDYPTELPPWKKTAYDGQKILFCAEEEKRKGGIFPVEDYLTVNIVPCSNKDSSLRKLDEYLHGRLPSSENLREVLQGLDLVMKENPARSMISSGRSFYDTRESKNTLGPDCGFYNYEGFQHSLKPTSQGLSLCLDHSTLAMSKRVPVLEFLKKQITSFNTYNYFCSPNDFESRRKSVEEVLKGLKVYVTHRKTKQKFVVKGLAPEIAECTKFAVVDPAGKIPDREVELLKYFKEKYGIEIKKSALPCLDIGRSDRRNYVPMEFCQIVEWQRCDKPKDEGMKRGNVNLMKPDIRADKIAKIARSTDGPYGGEIAKSFKIEVNTSMTTVRGRLIQPPELRLGKKGIKKRNIFQSENLDWNLVRRSLVQGTRINNWVVLDFSSEEQKQGNKLQFTNFLPKFTRRCRELDISIAENPAYGAGSMENFSSVETLGQFIDIQLKAARPKLEGPLQLILCVMSRKDPGYKYLKWIAETKIGVVTQCCLANRANKVDGNYLANLALKINAKLGGINMQVEMDCHLGILTVSEHVMFIGADVNHPGSRNTTTSPSIAAVAASMNWPTPYRYAARVRTQECRTEKIAEFADMCLELIECYQRLNKVKPKKIIIFRDGVSEGQFNMVLNEELSGLKEKLALQKYHPTVTLIVAQKRHQTRLFRKNSRGLMDNVLPGTVVEETIVHPFEFDFYLCSHHGSIGTSKPTHYHVLYDQHKFTSVQLQKLVFDMCFSLARCTKPVSVVPPVLYAHLAAYRGRKYQETVETVTRLWKWCSSPLPFG
ncbi:protein argonaute 2-like isoform X2 [Humulus lupulus]|uniref:protein argonaute 2-like isoform X2 n=1 Tax=Humulus lupulus TaxID=3486 RepID=UPI002B40C837|nr:protein argonaute 2-like isoform X2 [Humulus lupulus]